MSPDEVARLGVPEIVDADREGMAGMVNMLLKLLTTRQIPVTEEDRVRVLGCQDPDVLQRWFDRALTATSLTGVFG